MPVICSIALKTASTGPSPTAAAFLTVASLCHRQTAAEGIVAEPALQVTASSVQTTGPLCIWDSASASMSAS